MINRQEEVCACHGVSGTCSVQTCYLKVPEVGKIGEALVQKYDLAVRVALDSTNNFKRVDNPNANPLAADDLVYLENSPNFCEADVSNGILGTKDRLCELDVASPKSCDSLCCRRGYYQKTFIVPEEECRFVWCCSIECEFIRNVTITEYRCN